MLTASIRRQWADYFDSQGIQYAFFSAAHATALQQARRDALEAAGESSGEEDSVDEDEDDEEVVATAETSVVGPELAAREATSPPESETSEEEDESEETDSDDDLYADPISFEEDSEDAQDPRVRVLSVLELEELFVKAAPDLSSMSHNVPQTLIIFSYLVAEFTDSFGQQPSKLVVGLVGYPNVGKSSTINSLLGEKKVSVSSTPGKTKHFQTIQLSSTITLCDCPGLVFPQFATTRADLVCDGVLPIDQLREHTGPTALIVKRIPKEVLEAIYGLSIKSKSIEEGGDGKITAENLLITYAGQQVSLVVRLLY